MYFVGTQQRWTELLGNKPARRARINFRLLDTTGHPARAPLVVTYAFAIVTRTSAFSREYCSN